MGIARWTKCKALSAYWLSQWMGDDDAYNPNRVFLQNQIARPMLVLEDFILKQSYSKAAENGWEFLRYMTYMAAVLDAGKVQAVLSLDPQGVLRCCSEVIVMRLSEQWWYFVGSWNAVRSLLFGRCQQEQDQSRLK